MKSFKMVCTATILFLAICVPTFAGEINTPGFTPEPDPVSQPTPAPESGSASETTTQSSDASTSLAAILLTLSALF